MAKSSKPEGTYERVSLEKAEHLRTQAARLREAARTVKGADLRDCLDEIARQYDDMSKQD